MALLSVKCVFEPVKYSVKEPELVLVIQFLGDLSERDPPVPIPNTEVKPLSPDGTARASVWESRTLPRLNWKAPSPEDKLQLGAFAYTEANFLSDK